MLTLELRSCIRTVERRKTVMDEPHSEQPLTQLYELQGRVKALEGYLNTEQYLSKSSVRALLGLEAPAPAPAPAAEPEAE